MMLCFARLGLILSFAGISTPSAFAQTDIEIRDSFGSYRIRTPVLHSEGAAPTPHVPTVTPVESPYYEDNARRILGRFYRPQLDLTERGEEIQLRGRDFADAYYVFLAVNNSGLGDAPPSGPGSPRSAFFMAWTVARVLDAMAEPLSEPMSDYLRPQLLEHVLRSFLVRIALQAGAITSYQHQYAGGFAAMVRAEPAQAIQHLSNEELFRLVHPFVRNNLQFSAETPMRFVWEKDFPLYGGTETTDVRTTALARVEQPPEYHPIFDDVIRFSGTYPNRIPLLVRFPDSLAALTQELQESLRPVFRSVMRETLQQCGTDAALANREGRCGPVAFRPNFLPAVLRAARIRAHAGIDLMWPANWEAQLVQQQLFGNIVLAPLQLINSIQ